MGFGAWLGQPDSADRPFMLVLAQFLGSPAPIFLDKSRNSIPDIARFAWLGNVWVTRRSIWRVDESRTPWSIGKTTASWALTRVAWRMRASTRPEARNTCTSA